MSDGRISAFLTMSKTCSSASASPRARSARDWRSPSARRISDCWSASAARMTAWRAPSARRIADCFSPSAWRMVARLARSARICCSIASWIERGGSMLLSSTRVTRTPHFSVASSSTSRSWVLIWSRLVSVSSSVIAPTKLRSVVWASCSIAVRKFATSYVARKASVTWKYTTVSIAMVTLSSVMTGCGANGCTVSRISTTTRIRSKKGITIWSPGLSVARYLPKRSIMPTWLWRTILTADATSTIAKIARTTAMIRGAIRSPSGARPVHVVRR